MGESLVSMLYFSRRWVLREKSKDPEDYPYDGKTTYQTYESYTADTPMVLLVKLLESECALHDLTLCRWQTGNRYDGRIRTTSWGVARGDRPATSYDDAVIYVVRFSGNEGQTERCVAYRSLLNLLDMVMQGED